MIYKNLDYLRLNIDNLLVQEFYTLFSGLSDNSNTKKITYQNQTYFVLFSEFKNIYFYNLYKNLEESSTIQVKLVNQYNTSFQTNSITFYGNFFYNQYYRNFDFTPFLQSTVSRLDLCVDIPYSTKEFLGEYISTDFTNIKTTYKQKRIIENKNTYETVYFGQKQNNKTHFLRVYNKIADIIAKNKIEEYKDYLDYKNVTRVETQININTIKLYNITTLDIQHYLQNQHNSKINSLFAELMQNEKIFCSNLNILPLSDNVVKSVKQKKDSLHITDFLSNIIKYNQKFEDSGVNILDLLEKHLILSKQDFIQEAIKVFGCQ